MGSLNIFWLSKRRGVYTSLEVYTVAFLEDYVLLRSDTVAGLVFPYVLKQHSTFIFQGLRGPRRRMHCSGNTVP
jgi:hypothetical protein